MEIYCGHIQCMRCLKHFNIKSQEKSIKVFKRSNNIVQNAVGFPRKVKTRCQKNTGTETEK